MRCRDRAILTSAMLLCTIMLTGCGTGDMADRIGDFSDKFADMLPGTNKKPLPGDRKPVFPEGVPGVAQGLPPELVKGNQPPPDAADATPPVAKQAALDSEKPKARKKVQKPKPPEQTTQQANDATPARPVQSTAWPPPPGQQAPPAAWPAPPQSQAPWPASPQSQVAWPSSGPAPASQQAR